MNFHPCVEVRFKFFGLVFELGLVKHNVPCVPYVHSFGHETQPFLPLLLWPNNLGLGGNVGTIENQLSFKNHCTVL